MREHAKLPLRELSAPCRVSIHHLSLMERGLAKFKEKYAGVYDRVIGAHIRAGGPDD
jgi:hypothetical protein